MAQADHWLGHQLAQPKGDHEAGTEPALPTDQLQGGNLDFSDDVRECEVHEERSYYGQNALGEKCEIAPQTSHRDKGEVAETQGEGAESEDQQRTEREERQNECTESIIQNTSKSSKEEMPLFSKYGRRYRYRVEFDVIHSRQDYEEEKEGQRKEGRKEGREGGREEEGREEKERGKEEEKEGRKRRKEEEERRKEEKEERKGGRGEKEGRKRREERRKRREGRKRREEKRKRKEGRKRREEKRKRKEGEKEGRKEKERGKEEEERKKERRKERKKRREERRKRREGRKDKHALAGRLKAPSEAVGSPAERLTSANLLLPLFLLLRSVPPARRGRPRSLSALPPPPPLKRRGAAGEGRRERSRRACARRRAGRAPSRRPAGSSSSSSSSNPAAARAPSGPSPADGAQQPGRRRRARSPARLAPASRRFRKPVAKSQFARIEQSREVMKRQGSTGSPQERREEAETLSCAVRLEYMADGFQGDRSQEGQRETCKTMQQRWETQWQEFLRTLQPGQPGVGDSVPSEASPWEDPKAFLASFEQVAQACRWPRAEWAARLLPALSGEAEEAFQSLEPGDGEDYAKVKAAILREEAIKMEAQRQHFRQFCCQETEDPRRIHSQLQELCHQWLRPERRTKEQILELLILEQFLASLPPDLQSWIRAGGPDTCSQAVALMEEFLLNQEEDETRKWQEVCLGSLEVEEEEDLDPGDGQIYKEDALNSSGETSLLDSGIKCPSHASSLLSLEGPEMSETEQNEGSVSLQKTGVPLQTMEQDLIQPGPRTIFWQVLQEENGNMDCLGVKNRNWIKMETSLCGGSDPEETSRTAAQINTENVSMEDDVQKEGCDRRSWIKMENSQRGETVLEETPRTLADNSQWTFPASSNIHGLRWEFQLDKTSTKGKNEWCDLSDDLTMAVEKNHTVQTEGAKVLLSKHGQKCGYKSGFVEMQGKSCTCPSLEEKAQQTRYSDKHQKIHSAEQEAEALEARKEILGDDLMGYPKNQPDEELLQHLKAGKDAFTAWWWRVGGGDKPGSITHPSPLAKQGPGSPQSCDGDQFAGHPHPFPKLESDSGAGRRGSERKFQVRGVVRTRPLSRRSQRRSAGRGRWGQEPRLLCGSAINPAPSRRDRRGASEREREKARRRRIPPARDPGTGLRFPTGRPGASGPSSCPACTGIAGTRRVPSRTGGLDAAWSRPALAGPGSRRRAPCLRRPLAGAPGGAGGRRSESRGAAAVCDLLRPGGPLCAAPALQRSFAGQKGGGEGGVNLCCPPFRLCFPLAEPAGGRRVRKPARGGVVNARSGDHEEIPWAAG
ncbi:zinc finger protein [Crotalus adamanteus]|uniref:Zinc finger protein n=1 Tax=Crotalus adamanteus TaxID=8729 RepID=A0AAW1BU30_CROAD